MSTLLILSPTTGDPSDVVPALGLLAHRARIMPMDSSALVDAPGADLVFVDARTDLVAARTTCRLLRASGLGVPLVLVLTEGGLTAVTAEWGTTDVVLAGAGPAEVEARIRLAVGRTALDAHDGDTDEISAGELAIDVSGYTARLRGRPLDLTYKEFELIKHLVQHPGRVFTRDQLLQEVWGYDYYGGTRTIDVHVRRLRAKLGPEHDHLIGTVRNVGYRFDLPTGRRGGSGDSRQLGRSEDAGDARAIGRQAGGAQAGGAMHVNATTGPTSGSTPR